MKLISWNVNGIRAVMKKDFPATLATLNPDILCVQETKAQDDQVREALQDIEGYHLYMNSAVRKGYSGTAILSKEEPIGVVHDIGIEEHDQEGRVQCVEYPDFYLVNVYVPNSGSELARLDYRGGWATYNGDHMSMYAVNCSVPKTLVRHLVLWYATHKLSGATKVTLLDIADTPISPELIPANENGNIKQKTEDLVGPYILHDFFLYYFLRHGFGPAKIYFLAQYTFAEDFDKETILKWLKIFHRRFFQQQFKRSCVPDGPKVGSVSLSPRGDWRMPSDAKWSAWDVDIDV